MIWREVGAEAKLLCREYVRFGGACSRIPLMQHHQGYRYFDGKTNDIRHLYPRGEGRVECQEYRNNNNDDDDDDDDNNDTIIKDNDNENDNDILGQN